MGQYYKACLITEEKPTNVVEYVDSWSHNNGSKLMEHSWLGNNFVKVVEMLLRKGGAWYKKPIVWAGDYADKEDGTDENLYGLTEFANKANCDVLESDEGNPVMFIVNHSKKLYVNTAKLSTNHTWTHPDTNRVYEIKIHPLPLLTCEGNGNGGGDFCGKDTKNLVGSWARDIISVEDEKPEGYKELSFKMKEGRG
jgi:hypothetical protein